MHRDKIPPQRMHAACRIVTRGLCCTLRISAATVKTIVVWNNWSRRCTPHTTWGKICFRYVSSENRKLHQKILVQTTRLFAVLWGCTWTRISRQPIIAITWHFSQQTLLEPFAVTGASASCFGERFWDVLLSQNLDENNKQYSNKYRLLYNSSM